VAVAEYAVQNRHAEFRQRRQVVLILIPARHREQRHQRGGHAILVRERHVGLRIRDLRRGRLVNAVLFGFAKACVVVVELVLP
jgi:hypothetical protein